MEKGKRATVNVSVRIKKSSDQGNAHLPLQVISDHPAVLAINDRPQTYHFDSIFAENTDQETVYNDAVRPFVDHVMRGFNCTVFAYGQTGTGKTYTMGSGTHVGSYEHHMGIIPRALKQLLTEQVSQSCDDEISITFSEIYNEKVYDLWQSSGKKTPLTVSGFEVQGLTKKVVKDVEEALKALEWGNRNRHVAETKQNSNSSRSHAIFTIYYATKHFQGKLNLVDLAGSEGIKKTGNKGSTLHEGISINKSLLAIGKVISALSSRSNYIPYRDSIITSILQGSLNVDNFISLIACVSANPEDITETLQTLAFANTAKKVQSNPEVNQIVAQHKQNNPALFGSFRTPLRPLSRVPSTIHKQMIKLDERSELTAHPESGECPLSSTMISVNETTHQNFSPVVKKYMKQMEESMINRLQTIIQNTIQRPIDRAATHNTGNENTPQLNWENIRKQMTELVRSEVVQITREISSGNERVTKKLFKGNSPEESLEDVVATDFSFKKPNILFTKDDKSVRLSMSPIMQVSARRRSTRLWIKRQSCANELLDDNRQNFATNGRRKNRTTKHVDDTLVERKRRNLRRGTASSSDSPYTSRRKDVLQLLNHGSQSEIEKLHTVGVKSADKILAYRELKGGFKCISDLSKIPGWGEKKFAKFEEQNFLKK